MCRFRSAEKRSGSRLVEGRVISAKVRPAEAMQGLWHLRRQGKTRPAAADRIVVRKIAVPVGRSRFRSAISLGRFISEMLNRNREKSDRKINTRCDEECYADGRQLGSW
jgi:hypothetical protein